MSYKEVGLAGTHARSFSSLTTLQIDDKVTAKCSRRLTRSVASFFFTNCGRRLHTRSAADISHHPTSRGLGFYSGFSSQSADAI